MPRGSRKVVIYTEGPYSDRAFVEFEVLNGPPVVLDCWSESAREREAGIADIDSEITDALMTEAWRVAGIPRALGVTTEEQVTKGVLSQEAERYARPPLTKETEAQGNPPKPNRRKPPQGKHKRQKTTQDRPDLHVVPEPTTSRGLTRSDFEEDS